MIFVNMQSSGETQYEREVRPGDETSIFNPPSPYDLYEALRGKEISAFF